MRKPFFVFCAFRLIRAGLLCMLAVAASSGADATAGDAVLVEIDGTKLTQADLESRRPGSLFQARNTFYAAQQKAVQDLVDDYLLERQARKESLTVDGLLEAHVNSAIAKDPSEEALRVYYDGVDTTEPYEAVRDKILDAIRQRRLSKAKEVYLRSLRSQASINVRLAPPRAGISLKDTPVRGDPNAPVVVVEYADYECQYCQQIQPVLVKLEADFKGKIAFAYKDAPLPMHANAQKAAESARCAGAQGRYWEYHDLLFGKNEYQLPKLKEYARFLKLDGVAFDKCLDSGAQGGLVKLQLAEAQALGIPGTPAFFVNGRFITGAVSYDSLRQVIEEELRTSVAAANSPASR